MGKTKWQGDGGKVARLDPSSPTFAPICDARRYASSAQGLDRRSSLITVLYRDLGAHFSGTQKRKTKELKKELLEVLA